MVIGLVLLYLGTVVAANAGLQLNVFNNTAVYGHPVSSTAIDDLVFDVPVGTEALSAEVTEAACWRAVTDSPSFTHHSSAR